MQTGKSLLLLSTLILSVHGQASGILSASFLTGEPGAGKDIDIGIPLQPDSLDEQLKNFLSRHFKPRIVIPETEQPEQIDFSTVFEDSTSRFQREIEEHLKEMEEEYNGNPPAMISSDDGFIESTSSTNLQPIATTYQEKTDFAPDHHLVPPGTAIIPPEGMAQYGGGQSTEAINQGKQEEELEETEGEASTSTEDVSLNTEAILTEVKVAIKPLDHSLRHQQVNFLQGFFQIMADTTEFAAAEHSGGVPNQDVTALEQTSTEMKEAVQKLEDLKAKYIPEGLEPDEMLTHHYSPKFLAVVNQQVPNLVVLRKVPGLRRAAEKFNQKHSINPQAKLKKGQSAIATMTFMIAYHQRRASGITRDITLEMFERLNRNLLNNPEIADQEESLDPSPDMDAQTQSRLSQWMPDFNVPEAELPEGTHREQLKLPEREFARHLPPGSYTFRKYQTVIWVDNSDPSEPNYYLYILGQNHYLHTHSHNAVETWLNIYRRIWWQDDYDGTARFFMNGPHYLQILEDSEKADAEEEDGEDGQIPVPQENFNENQQ